MKMSDVFGLPLVVCRTNPQMITAKPTCSGKTDFHSCTIRSPMELEVSYATHAINNHDRMVEDIAELKEFVEMVANGINEDPQGAVVHLRIHSREAKRLLAKLNQEGEE